VTLHERAERLLRNLRERREWYARMGEMAREQKALLTGDGAGLAEFVEKKRSVMEQLERLAAEAPNLRAEWESLKARLSPAEAAPIEAELAAVAEVLGAAVREEEEGRKLAEAARAATSGEMKQAVEAKRAAAAYGKAAGGGVRFVDRRD
jgi:hypothetical protein